MKEICENLEQEKEEKQKEICEEKNMKEKKDSFFEKESWIWIERL